MSESEAGADAASQPGAGGVTEPRFAAVIPAFECSATIEDVVAGTLAQLETVVVVDDGSQDDTADRAARAGAEVLSNPRNLGKGASLRRGLEWCRERGFSHAVSIDGDGQHLGSQIPTLLDQTECHPNAIVIGQRIVDPSRVSSNKLFGNRFANRWVEIACGEALPDTQSGFRVYPVAATLGLGSRADRFAFETEVLIRAVRAGVPVRSVEVEVYYPPADERHSHYRPWIDTIRIIFVVLGLIFRLY